MGDARNRDADSRWMREALRLAARARGKTAPNPMVGCVVVRDGVRVAGGLHVEPGRPHAEAVALSKAGAAAEGATLYVNLEPCAHYGRTPPCVDAVLAAGVRRVVVGMLDPDPRTSGRSMEKLRSAGIEISVGIEEPACHALNQGFESRVVRSRPFTTLKLAASWDGRVATASGESRWITSEPARHWVHRLRAQVDAIAVGSQTARIDDPELTARQGGEVVHRPRRIVVDSQLALPPGARMLDPSRAGSLWIFTAADAPLDRRRALEKAGAVVVEVPRAESRLSLPHVWTELAARGVNDLLVEGGGELGAALLRAALVDRLHLFLAPMLLGSSGRPVLGDLSVATLHDVLRPKTWRHERVGADLLLSAEW